MSEIPKARARLRTIDTMSAAVLKGDMDPMWFAELVHRELPIIDGMLIREPAIQKTARKRVTTNEVIDKVIEMHARRPELSEHDIAEACGTNIGRVSEILNGKRGRKTGALLSE